MLKERVAIVTGAGAGLGRAYALDLVSQGCSVLINDCGKKDGKQSADLVVEEIIAKGGKAVANYDPVGRDIAIAERIVKQAVDAFGKVDIIINNAGVLRDVSFLKQTEKEWETIFDIHVYGARNICKAAWPLLRKQGYGRIINVSSSHGVKGAFGQTNYSAAKAGIIGFTKSLALEGAKYNINVNVVIPTAGTSMTATTLPKEIVIAADPKFVAPFITYLTLEEAPTGRVFEAGCGYFAELKWSRAPGVFLDISKGYTVDDIKKNWEKITDMIGATDCEAEDSAGSKQLSQVLAKL